MNFPESLKNLRVIRGVVQKHLADMLNTTVMTVSHWETGYSEPSIAQLIELADYFDVTLDELTGRNG